MNTTKMSEHKLTCPLTDQAVQAKLDKIKANIGTHPNFPKPGIIFRDVFPLFYNPSLLEDVMQLIEDHIRSASKNVNAIVGLEARGFLLGPMLALRLNVPFIPIRKAGKLPGKVKSIKYELEYGSDKFEIQTSSIIEGQNYIIVDDLLATGGSLKTAASLIRDCGGNVIESIVIIELLDLKGRDQIQTPIFSLVQY